MQSYDDVPSIVTQFLNYKKAIQNRSDKTVFQYYHDLRTYCRFLLIHHNKRKYKDIELCDIPAHELSDDIIINASPDDVFEFLSFAANELNNQNSSRQRKLSCLRSFYKYLSKIRRIIEKDPTEAIDRPSKPKSLPKFLTLEESKQLLASIDGNNAIRDFCIVTLFLNCGMRVSELCGIDISDISPDFSTVNVTGKGSKERILYLNDACVSALTAYLKVRPQNAKHKDRNALFISRNHNRLSVQMVQTLIYKHLKNAGLEYKNMSVHKLRHTAATLMYQYGKTDVRVLKDILGHEQLSTTQIYTHINNDMIREAAMDNPLSSVKRTVKAKNAPSDNSDE